ncbi:hypothetical protein CPC08DRAFT_517257 [Agrocybe pediades]|nr:hypothetical protein CPC08DRAFT_517257 [Agrocybe pediades]
MPIESQTLDTSTGMDPVNCFAHFSPKDRQIVDQSLGAHKRFVYGEAIHLGRRSEEADPVESVRFFVQFVMNQFYYVAHSRDGRAVVASNVVGSQQCGLEGADENPPAIMVLGIGGPFPPFSTDVDPFHLSMTERYRHCVVPIMVSRTKESSQAANWAHVARNLFSKQPARLFFYGLEFLGRNCRIVLCHRAGSQFSPYIGMGDMYLSSIIYTCLPWDPIMLGFDGGSSPIGGKIGYLVLRSGTVYATQNDGSPIHHRICDKIQSRGSTVWRVKRVNPEGGLQATTHIVKQSWRTAKSILAELKLLAMLRGLSGFAQVKGHVPKMRIDVLPGISEKIASAMTEEMRLTFSNIVFEDHGRPLDRFASTQELLYATRDAVRGIIYLWGLGILHTNIDPSHILISRSDDNVSGVRGVLIDFKDAQQVGHNGRLPRASYRMGLPSFHSLSVLHVKWDSLTFRPRTPYDDMESVFWILVGICQTFTAPGCQIDDPKHIHRSVRRYWLRFPEDENLPSDPELVAKKELLGLQLHESAAYHGRIA